MSSAQPARAADDATRATMQRVFESLELLLPRVLDGSFEAEEAGPEEVREAVAHLSQAASRVGEHAPPSNSAFAFLSRSLASDARAVERRVQEGRYADAGYRLVRMTETCVACHSRLPSDREAPMTASLTETLEGRDLDPLRLARFEMALRQFDRALDGYEALLADPETPPAQLDYSGALADYLILALRVRSAGERAERTLKRFAQRGDLTEQLRRNLPTWISTIERRRSLLEGEPSLAAARSLLEEGAALGARPSDRADLVHRVMASALLYRWLEKPGAPKAERAEALLLLGETDAFVRRSFEQSEAEFYLEQAIRAAPGTEVAREAYAELEDQVLFGYTGSSGLNLPPDVERTLQELRALSRGPGAGKPR